jgi:DNA-binding protein VF530
MCNFMCIYAYTHVFVRMFTCTRLYLNSCLSSHLFNISTLNPQQFQFSLKGNIGSSKNAFDAIAAEAEKSASNTLKSKAIKEAKLLAKLEGKEVKKTSVKKREVKTKPQNAESGYEKKVRISDREYNAMRQSEGREYKEGKLGREDIVVKKSEKIDLSTSEIEEEDSLIEELMAKNVLSPKSLESEKNIPVQKKEIVGVEPTPAVKKEVEKVVYVKLKRRIEDEDEDENSENRNPDRSYDFNNLEDLDDRMDELYGDLESNSVKTETDMIITDLAPKSLKGSNSKDPIKWKNGRLVNEKDKFFNKIRAQTIDSDDENSEEEDEDDEGSSEGDATERKTIIKKSSSKKVVVELTGVTMKNMLEHLETTIGFDGLFSETNLRCFSVKPSINSALKVLRQLPLEWARKKIEYLYIQSKKRQ